MGDIQEGNVICDAWGSRTEVIAVYPHKNHPFYRISFSDGTNLECGPEHLWLAWRSGKCRKIPKHPDANWHGKVHGPSCAKIMRTDRIMREMDKGRRYRIPLTIAAVGNVNKLKIDPYVLGALLGDGSLVRQSVTITCHQDDDQVLSEIARGIEKDFLSISAVPNKPHLLNGRLSSLSQAYGNLERAGLIGKRSWEKFLPEHFLHAPIEWRWSLLQGLMDTDGSVEPKRAAFYCTTSTRLRDDVASLARSLGCFVTIVEKAPSYTYNGERRSGRPAYVLRIKSAEPSKLFRLERKKAIASELKPQSLSKVITDIEYLGKDDGACISVDCPTGLYLTNDYTVTHNTWAQLFDPLRNIEHRKFAGVIFRRYYKDITGPGSLWEQSKDMYFDFGGKPKESPQLKWKFPSGAELEFAHLQLLDDIYRWKGREMPYIGWEELTEFLEEQFWYLFSRNRSTGGFRSCVRGTTNPDADSFVRGLVDWWIDEDGYAIQDRSGIVRYFVRPHDELVWADKPEKLLKYTDRDGEPLQPISFTFVAAKLSDNKALTNADPRYKGKLQILDRVQRARLKDGNWNIRPAAGEYFQESWVRPLIKPREVPPNMDMVRAWDFAATDTKERRNPDWTVGTLMGREGNKYYILDHVYARRSPGQVEKLVLRTAEEDGRGVKVGLPQEPGAAGKAWLHSLVTKLAGYNARGRVQTGDKVKRFSPFSAQAEHGNVHVMEGRWNKRLFSELENFPPASKSAHDDDADAISLAFDFLVNAGPLGLIKRWGGA